MRVLLRIAAALFAIVVSGYAEAYPTRPIRFIVPFPPGGSYDAMARMVALKLTDAWGQQVVVDNRPGAAATIGADLAARAEPDGHTIVLLGNNHTIAPSVFRKLPYDLLRDLAPVTLLATTPYVVVVHPSVPVKTLRELIDLAKARPGQLNYGSGGTGGITHLAGELFNYLAAVNIVHVPYKGGVPAVTDLVGGRLQMMTVNVFSALPHIKAGKLRGLAVPDTKRSRFVPELPTTAEAGLPGFEISEWYGVSAPRALPKPILAKLNAEIARILGLSDVRERLTNVGSEPVPSTPEQFAAFLKADLAKNAEIIRKANIRLD
ncbi:MAG: tripartite tricarboxylate transporter substrate binding protein [Betaproteobacteria bacterium]|nr:tripartite tricarboxylate transporter substrate binding protein [Betaproteobacteria bacterium]